MWTTWVPTGALCLAALVALAGCGGGGGASSAPTPHGPARLVLDVNVRPAGTSIWQTAVTAHPGEVLQHQARVANVGGAEAVDVRVRDELGRGERSVFGSGHIQSLGVSGAIGPGLKPGLFGRGTPTGPLPDGGTTVVIQFETVAGRNSFAEPVVVDWAGGSVRGAARVQVEPPS